MAVRKRGGVWYYDFMINYVRYKKAVPEARTKAQAEHAETQARLEVFQGKYGRPMGDSGFIEFAEEVWLPWSREIGRASCRERVEIWVVDVGVEEKKVCNDAISRVLRT